MSSLSERLQSTSDWGIEPVPQRLRTLSGFDMAILWGDLGLGLLVLVAGGLLVPGLGFGTALVAIVLGSVVGVTLLALAGAVGARHGVPTMVLFRPVLGIRGSWAPSALNALQLVGWTAVELWAMSYVADIVVERTFGFSARGLWLVIAAAVCTGLALWGPIGVTRIWMERFGAWVIALISLAVSVLVFRTDGIGDILSAPGTGALSFGPALDLVIALPASWAPLVADYTRFSKRVGPAFQGTFWGFLIANVWLYALGALLVLSTGTDPSPAGIAGGILALAGGSVAGVLFLTGLLVGETDEAFADIYSAAVCLQNIVPRISRAVTVIVIAAVSTLLAAWLTMERYEAFLFLIGSVFLPLFGVMAAHPFIRCKHETADGDLYKSKGPYWFSNGFRWAALPPWIAGFAVYHWILPTGPSWWTDLVAKAVAEPLVVRFPWLNASIPSFVVAFLLALLILRPGRAGGPSDGAVYHPEHPQKRGDL
ncbi:MAG: cytosine permease [Actinomycetota bacterium]|nr:cytosine permease [Actinomycetota bacterium]